MQTFQINSEQDLKQLGKKIKESFVELPKTGIIGIDGAMQSGKSKTISVFLAKLLKAEILDLDSFIQVDEKSIIYKKESIELGKNKLYIADGVLNRKILKHYGAKTIFDIYVKKMVNYGWVERNWLDEDTVRDYGLDKSFLNSNINVQIYKYHIKYKPLKKANLILEIAEEYIIRDLYV